MTRSLLAVLVMSLLPVVAAGNPPTALDVDRDEDGYTPIEGDCDDERSDTGVGMPELCGDGVDNDCDGQTDGDDGDCRAWLPAGSVCGLAHYPTTEASTCDGQFVGYSEAHGGYICPAGWAFFSLKDVAAESDFFYVWGCRLQAGRWVSERPQGLVIGYGHSQNLPWFPVRDTTVSWTDQTCPAGSEFFTLAERGGDAESAYIGCRLSETETVTGANRDDVVGQICGASHTDVSIWGHRSFSCEGVTPVPGDPNSCPDHMELVFYGDRGGGVGTGQYACRYHERPDL